MKKIWAYLKIIRVNNSLFAFLCTLFGFYYMKNLENLFIAIITSLCTFFIAAGGYALNDYYDFKIDVINKPTRPLPQGTLSLQDAQKISSNLFGTGILLGFFLIFISFFNIEGAQISSHNSINLFFIVVVNATFLFLYALHLKKVCFLGNLIIAWSACSTFLFGALGNDNLKNIFPLICLSFLYTLLREWVKTIEDYEGDRRENARTLAVVIGESNTWRFVFWGTAFTLIISIIFYFQDSIPPVLFLTICFIIIVPSSYFIVILKKPRFEDVANKIQKYMKYNMLAVVIAYVINDVIQIRI